MLMVWSEHTLASCVDTHLVWAKKYKVNIKLFAMNITFILLSYFYITPDYIQKMTFLVLKGGRCLFMEEGLKCAATRSRNHMDKGQIRKRVCLIWYTIVPFIL